MIGVSALVLTFNEEPNIARTLSRLSWIDEVVVLDSCSTDATRDIAAGFSNVRVVQRAFTTHADQWNFGLSQLTTEWVLALDADFVLSDEVIAEVAGLAPPQGVSGYAASFVYCIHGRPLRSGVYPPVTVLFRRAEGRYEQDGHTQRVAVRGAVVPLRGKMAHDDRKSIAHWVASQVKYMRLEAAKLDSTPAPQLSVADRMRKAIVLAPPLMFLLCLVGRGGLFDGWPGVYYALQRAAAETILSLTLLERRLTRRLG